MQTIKQITQWKLLLLPHSCSLFFNFKFCRSSREIIKGSKNGEEARTSVEHRKNRIRQNRTRSKPQNRTQKQKRNFENRSRCSTLVRTNAWIYKDLTVMLKQL